MSTIDSTNGSELVEFESLDGKAHKLKKITPSDFVQMSSDFLAKRKSELRENLDECKVDGLHRLAVLNEFDAKGIRRADFIDAAQRIDIQHETIRRSIARTRGCALDVIDGNDVDRLEIPQENIYRLTLRLMHLQLADRPLARPAQTAADISAGHESESKNSSANREESAAVLA